MIKLTPAPKFQLIGHRGTRGLRPENTYCSFRHAAELGLNWIEFDVQLSKDDQWFVMHDNTIERTTNGQGKISDYSAEDLDKLQAGLWYNPPYPGEPIPTLSKTMELANQLGLYCNIEIKASNAEPKKYAKLMADFIKQHNINALISSFDTNCIIELRKLLPENPISYLIDYFAEHTIDIVQENNFTSINCDYKNITEGDLKLAKDHAIPVLLYTVNDPVVAKMWLNRGVAAIFTDRPDLLMG
jgi:glycerophosphoryl diester phosphodiesterase